MWKWLILAFLFLRSRGPSSGAGSSPAASVSSPSSVLANPQQASSPVQQFIPLTPPPASGYVPHFDGGPIMRPTPPPLGANAPSAPEIISVIGPPIMATHTPPEILTVDPIPDVIHTDLISGARKPLMEAPVPSDETGFVWTM